MEPERWQQVERIYHATLEREWDQRGAYLEKACGADEALRRDVEGLLAYEEQARSFIEAPAIEIAARQKNIDFDPSREPADHFRLAPGDRLGPYEILKPLGAGGMGEVYRARDPRMRREVAIKISAERFSDRFSREVHAVAALNHPNISHLYDVGPNYLVMELVEGPTLAERIKQGAVPLEEALGIARQIADALEAAHEKGIVHRDLKPGNIKIRPDGTVKVLDFGLAKIVESAGVVASTEDSPTLTQDASTQLGVILGTAAYMSPEQARGKPVDKRSDIWAFGVVFYELLTGERLFKGEDVSEILAAVIKEEPRLDLVPAGVRPLLRACLQRDPKQRLRDIADAKLLLDTESEDRRETASPRYAVWTVAVVFSLAFGAVSFIHLREKPPAPPVPVRFQIAAPSLSPGDMALSPDGRTLVYTGVGLGGKSGLWIRSFDTLDSRALPGTEGAVSPFWSPDGRFIGFAEGPRLKKIEASGVTPPETLSDIGGGTVLAGSWNADGVIIFGSLGPLRRVSAEGGTPTVITAVSDGEFSHSNPVFLPDGRHFLYTRIHPDRTTATYLGSLDAKAVEQRNKRVLVGVATFVPTAQSGGGNLLFLRGATLMVQPYDTTRLELTGEPTPVAEQVGSVEELYGFFAGSATVLAYRMGAGQDRQLAWYDRKGAVLGTVGSPARFGEVELSPDGSRAAAYETNDQSDIWLFDLARNAKTRFTFDPGPERSPLWSPDGSQIVFTSNGATELYRKAANGAGGMELLLKSPEPMFPMDWSRDGRFLMYVTGSFKTGASGLWVLPLEGERKPAPVLVTPFWESQARFSPDGRWIVYRSNESGSVQIYVRPFVPSASFGAAAGAKWMISNGGGGYQPRWRRDGKEILYLSPSGKMMSAEVKLTGDSFEAAAPRPLFDAIPDMASTQLVVTLWDMTPDGQRFLLNTAAGDSKPSSITVVLNWQARLKK